MKRGFILSTSNGFSTLEMMLAIAIALMTMAAVFTVSYGFQSTVLGGQTNAEAVTIAQNLLESAQATAKSNFSSLANSSGVCTLGPGCTTNVTFSTPTDPNCSDPALCKLATALVSWSGDHQQPLIVRLSTLVTNPAAAGGQCTQTSTTGWDNPQHHEYSPSADSALGNHSNGIGLSNIQTYQQRMYVTATSTANTAYTFLVYDLPTYPNQDPTFRGGINNNLSIPVNTEGLNAVAINGTYAYVATARKANYTTCSNPTGANTDCAQLQVINVSDPTLAGTPIKYSLKIPGVIGSNGQGVGKTVFYSNGYVYIGLTKVGVGSTAGEFNIIDVGGGGGLASPTNPIPKGSYPIGRSVENIYVKGTYAYVATDDNTKELYIFDISNPFSPTPVGSFDAPANDAPGNNSGLGNAIYVNNNGAYLGRTYSLSSNDPEFYALDATNPASSLPVLSSFDVGTNAAPDSVNGVAVRSNLAFMITNRFFNVWNLTTQQTVASLALSGFVNGNGANTAGTALNCSGSYLYVALISPQGNHKDIISTLYPNIPFDYGLTTSGGVTVSRGSSKPLSVTVAQSSGIVPQSVTLTFSSLPSHVTVSPSSGSCNPNGSTCTANFTISAGNNAPVGGPTSITVTGASPAHTATFGLTIQ